MSSKEAEQKAMEIVRSWGRKGAKLTNSKLTPDKRSRASKKGWRLRKQRLSKKP